MELTKGQALELHWQMWTDMQKELGDNPSFGQRDEFKAKWCETHFPNEKVDYNCFLCEYVSQHHGDECDCCPIKWDDNCIDDCCMLGGVNYRYSPISEILALPVRGEENEQSY